MNDTELDQMLDTWHAPEAPASGRAALRARYRAALPAKRFTWLHWRMPVLASAAASAALLWAAQAFPQTFHSAVGGGGVPYVVESEYTGYPNGVPKVFQFATSYMHGTREFMLSYSIPGHPIETMHNQTIAWVQQTFLGLSAPFRADQEREDAASAAALVKNGCVDGTVAGRETILGYPTVAVRHEYGRWRVTKWMTPDLNCFPLKQFSEEQGPGGVYRLSHSRRAVKVTVN